MPGEEIVNFIKGDLSKVRSISELADEGIVFHNFYGDEIFQIADTKTVSISEISMKRWRDVELPFLTKEAYLNTFEKVHSKIIQGECQKLVLSRIISLTVSKSPLDLFNGLNQKYSNTLNYIFSSDPTNTWIGATPELLLEVTGKNIKTVSLAGTKRVSEDWTEKEIVEQKMVTDFILDVLNNCGCSNINISGPETIDAGPVQHLKTNISAEIENHEDWKNILKQLHPTPATCGLPAQKAKNLISKIEPHDRKFYTGFIGILTKEKKQFFVNLRCMELFENKAHIYVGGGITADSIAEKEWEETERKAKTLIDVLM